MDRKDFSNLGEDIKEIVSEAVNNMDFNKLSQDIKKTTKDALEEAKAGLEAGKLKMQNRYGQARKVADLEKIYNAEGQNENLSQESQSEPKTEHRIQPGIERPWNNEAKQKGTWHGQARQEQSGSYPAPDYRYGGKNTFLQKRTAYLAKHPAGTISGTLMVVFGSMFSSGFGITAFVLFCIMVANGFSGVFQALFFGFFVAAVVSGVFAYRGNQRTLRVRRFRQYARILGDRTFCQLEELAIQIGRDKRFIVDDVRKMIAQGMFPQGHLDDQETCLMITDESYQQYRITMDEYRKREEQERRAVEAVAKESQYQENERIKREKKEKKKKEKETKDSIYDNEAIDRELLNAYKEGKGYLDEISKVNKEISETQISKKVSHMEVVIRRIFKQVQTHPEQLEEIRRFMEYYLPTTLKLVTTYSEFDAQPVQGENIKKAKHEIEETLDTINEAFEKLLDSLFEAAALDISTDISVMNAMLTQEGLKKDIFES